MMSSYVNTGAVTLFGHPFSPTGVGNQLRNTFRAMKAAGVNVRIHDIYGFSAPENGHFSEFANYQAENFSDINIFHINGDEVNSALIHLATKNLIMKGYNIIYPNWELENYPSVWASELNRFDEIWAQSWFTFRALSSACHKPVLHMPNSNEVKLKNFLPRSYFGLPEKKFLFLFSFDMSSYAERKNPQAVIDAFKGLNHDIDTRNCSLVIKVNNAKSNLVAYKSLLRSINEIKDKVIIFENIMDDNEIKNLIRNCDSFVSLHRSEGWGFGLAEAMELGRLAIGTSYSGNMDFMNEHNSLLVDYVMKDIVEGDYPFSDGQRWADPNIESAIYCMKQALIDGDLALNIGQKAKFHMKCKFGHRSIGVAYLNRLNEVLNTKIRVFA